MALDQSLTPTGAKALIAILKAERNHAEQREMDALGRAEVLAAQLRAAVEQLDACEAFLEEAEAENVRLRAELAAAVGAPEASGGR
jgi:hypothetical protein